MKIFQKGELKLLWPFYLDSIISTIFFFIPIFFVVYFTEIEFSLFQISILLAIPSIFSLLLEIPTGAVADLYGRKLSVLLGIFLQVIAVTLLYFFTDFYAVAFIFAFMGVGASFISGANEAWITDLINKKDKHLLLGFFAKDQSIASIGLIVSGFLGAIFVKHFGTRIIWPAAALSLILSLIILSFAKEVFTRKRTDLRHSFRNVKVQTKKSIKYSWNNKTVFSLILASVLISIAYAPLGLGFVPLLQNLDFPEYAFGYFWSAISVVGVVAPLIAQKVFKHGKERKFIFITTLLAVLVTLAIFFADTIPVALSVILALIFFFDMRSPVLMAYFQSFVPSKIRATLGSVKGMILSLTSIIFVPISGFLLDLVGPKNTIFYASFIAIPAAIIYYRIRGQAMKER